MTDQSNLKLSGPICVCIGVVSAGLTRCVGGVVVIWSWAPQARDGYCVMWSNYAQPMLVLLVQLLQQHSTFFFFWEIIHIVVLLENGSCHSVFASERVTQLAH